MKEVGAKEHRVFTRTRTNRHHRYWPRCDYQLEIEIKFRNLPENIQIIPIDDHILIHQTQSPPEKPSLEFMRNAVIAHHRRLREQAISMRVSVGTVSPVEKSIRRQRGRRGVIALGLA